MTKARVLLNRQSGEALDRSPQIVAAFAAHGIACEVVAFGNGENATQLAREACRQPDTLVVAAGGDGTINAVAAGLAGTGCSMGVLPLGSLNHFARDLGLPLDLEAAVAVICTGTATPIDAAEVNGHLFVNNSSLGLYPAMVTQRERLRRVGWNRWLSLTAASIFAFLRFRHIHLRIAVEGAEHLCTTPFLFVGNNEYRIEGEHIGTRAHLDRARLFVHTAPGISRWDVLRITLAGALGRVREVPGYQEFCVTEFSVESRRRHLRVSLDGETLRLRTPLVYRIRPGALSIIRPKGDL
jgi:diacylglycerol kinase family enzyme